MGPPVRLQRLLAGLLLIAGLLVMQAQPAAADDLAAIRQRGVLIVGVKDDYPPFGFRAPSGQIVGIEPALAGDLARSLGVKLELVPVLASNRIQLLQDGKIDLIIATMNDTLERRQAVEIVKPYYYAAGYTVLAPKATPLSSWTELKGKQVCGIRDAWYNYEAATNAGLRIVEFPALPEALAALRQGQCAALLYDDTSIAGLLLQPAWSDFTTPLDAQGEQPWGIAVRKNQPEWAKYVAAAIQRWTRDGTIVNLETEYRIRHSKFANDAHRRASTSGN